jgi:hypothetical protein
MLLKEIKMLMKKEVVESTVKKMIHHRQVGKDLQVEER